MNYIRLPLRRATGKLPEDQWGEYIILRVKILNILIKVNISKG